MDKKMSITFNEKMSGPFAHGETDPAHGERTGKTIGSVLTMHASISVDDLERFGVDPDHTGRLEATIDYTPFGDGIRAKSGVFKLFTPPDSTGTKNMIYAFGLQHQGEEYYLYGHKDVRNDAGGLDLWKDTTTLYTTLHKGADRSAPIVGAGILGLGIVDLLKLVSTMRAMNGGGVEETAAAVAKFGKIFMGELWDTYAKRASTKGA